VPPDLVDRYGVRQVPLDPSTSIEACRGPISLPDLYGEAGTAPAPLDLARSHPTGHTTAELLEPSLPVRFV
jgi:hypothetical protein